MERGRPMVRRIYVEKKKEFAIEAKDLYFELKENLNIKEIAYFIPPNPNKAPEESFFPGFPGPRNATTEDVIVDDRGYIIIDALDDGFYILKMKEDK
jgi:hypothetical protein